MKLMWSLIGGVALALAIIGVALPVMPTVPFLLVAAWAFSKSSPRLRQRILEHPVYGPPVRAWQERGAVGRMAKIWAVSAMSGGVLLSLWLGLPLWVVGLQFATCAAIACYVVTRPEA